VAVTVFAAEQTKLNARYSMLGKIGPLLQREAKKQTKKSPRQEQQDRLDQAQNDRLAELELNADRLDKRGRAVIRFGQFQSEFMASSTSWHSAAKKIGSAYVTAYNTHKDVVDRQSASDALAIQMVFNVLTVVTAGGLSWVNQAVQAGISPVLQTMAKGVESASQAAADKIYGSVGPLLYPANLNGGVNPHPQVFQNELEQKVLEVQQLAFKAFGVIYQAWNAAPLHAWDGYREAHQMALHAGWKARAEKLTGAEHLPSVQAMADELEIGFWARYILEEHSHLEFPGTDWRMTDESYDYVGDVIYDRLVELHITTAAGLPAKPPSRWGRPAHKLGQALGEAINKLVKWAKDHKPRDFVSIKYPIPQR
jgi:hypothetical protein